MHRYIKMNFSINKGYIYLFITFFLYGSLYAASKFVLGSVPPLTLMLMRQSTAVILLGLMAFRKGFVKIRREDIKYFAALGILGYFLSVALQTVATNLMNASVSALFNSINPIFITLFAVIILKEKLTVNKIIGIACSLAGVAVIIGVSGDGVNMAGLACSAVSVIVWSLISVMVRQISSHYPPEQLTAIGFLVSLPFYIVSSAVELQTHTVTLTPQVVLLIGYIAVFCTALAYYLWNTSLSMIDASVCSLFYPLQTLFASLLGIIFLHETLSADFIAGSLLISAGIVTGLFPAGMMKKLLSRKKNNNI